MSRLLSVSVGRAAPLAFSARGAPETVASGIVKTPVSTLARPLPVEVGALGLAGDEQVDLTVHGGREKAVYVYPVEHYAFWKPCARRPRSAHRPRTVRSARTSRSKGCSRPPCGWATSSTSATWCCAWRARAGRRDKLNAHLGFGWAAKMMTQSGYTGFYCSVVRQGNRPPGMPSSCAPAIVSLASNRCTDSSTVRDAPDATDVEYSHARPEPLTAHGRHRARHRHRRRHGRHRGDPARLGRPHAGRGGRADARRRPALRRQAGRLKARASRPALTRPRWTSKPYGSTASRSTRNSRTPARSGPSSRTSRACTAAARARSSGAIRLRSGGCWYCCCRSRPGCR